MSIFIDCQSVNVQQPTAALAEVSVLGARKTQVVSVRAPVHLNFLTRCARLFRQCGTTNLSEIVARLAKLALKSQRLLRIGLQLFRELQGALNSTSGT